MKNKIFVIAMLFGMLFSANTTAQLSGKKVFIDPGHGGFTSNDRNRATIPYALGNTAGFWESTANLRKSTYLMNFCTGAGASVSRSRTSTSQDPGLSARCIAANNFGATFYISIHSNAGVSGSASNYILILWNGTDATPTYASSKNMAYHVWDKMITNPVTIWTSYTSSRNCRGDRSFLGYNLGALASLTRGGILTEGSFHDYNPEAHRLLSNAYCQMEAYNIYRGICVNQGGGTFANHGSVVGWVKTQKNSQKMTSSYPTNGSRYLPTRAGTHDEWPAVNGAVVQLRSGNTVVQSYTVDNNWNGIYGFFNVAPGNYTVRITASGYNCKEAGVSVTRGGLTSSNHYLTVGSTACSGGTTPPPNPTVNYILGISSTANAPYTPISNTVVLGTYSNKVYLSINSGTAAAPTWVSRTACDLTSSNTNVATIDASGNITLKAAGSTTLTAVDKSNSSAKGTITLTINNPAAPPPTPAGNLRLVVGTASTPSGSPSTYGTHVTDIPLNQSLNRYLGIDKNNNAANPSWDSRTLYDLTSSDNSIATVSASGTISTYAKNGTVVFTATLKTDATKKGSISIKVGTGVGSGSTNTVRLVAGTDPNAPYGTLVTSVPVGQLRYLGIDKNNNPSSPSWASRTDYTLTTSNANVATISASGSIVGIANGTVKITAVNKTDGNMVGSIDLTIGAGGTNPPVPTPGSLLLNLSSTDVGNVPISGHIEASVQMGTTNYLYIKNHRGDPVNRLESALGIDDAHIATIDERGKITLRGIGETVIRASSFDDVDTEMEGSLILKVTAAPQPLTSLILGFSSVLNPPYDPIQPSVSVGEVIFLTISDGTATPVQRIDCVLTSSVPDVASIAPDGTVTGLEIGTTIITATRKDGNKASGTIELFVEGGIDDDDVGVAVSKLKAINVYHTKTGITAEFEGKAIVELFNLAGILIDKVQVSRSYSRNLDKGVYILRINGQAIKFVK